MGNWQVDAAHTSVNFAVRHMMVTTVHGSFTEVEFPEMAFDPDHPEHGRVVATIKAASISTGDPGRDGAGGVRNGSYDSRIFGLRKYCCKRERTSNEYLTNSHVLNLRVLRCRLTTVT